VSGKQVSGKQVSGKQVSGKRALDQATVVSTALRLLDEVGLDGLTLRRLAHELGVQAPALYWHFKNKRELLDHMALAITEQARPSSRPAQGQQWDDWLFEQLCRGRRALLSHRDGALVAAGNRPPESSFPRIEETLDALCEVGFSPGFALRSLINLGNYVNGFVLEEQAERRRFEEEGTEAEAQRRFVLVASSYPRLWSAFTEVGDPQGDAGFEQGLRLMIDGMRAALPAQRPHVPDVSAHRPDVPAHRADARSTAV
jgi:TetR/AcrR family transcriptional regulator, tetracycline repressor protein